MKHMNIQLLWKENVTEKIPSNKLYCIYLGHVKTWTSKVMEMRVCSIEKSHHMGCNSTSV